MLLTPLPHPHIHARVPSTHTHTHTQRNISQTCTHISQPKICLIYRQGLWHQTQIQFNSVTLYSSQKGLCDCEPQTSSRLVDFFPSFFDSGRRCCCCFVWVHLMELSKNSQGNGGSSPLILVIYFGLIIYFSKQLNWKSMSRVYFWSWQVKWIHPFWHCQARNCSWDFDKKNLNKRNKM